MSAVAIIAAGVYLLNAPDAPWTLYASLALLALSITIITLKASK